MEIAILIWNFVAVLAWAITVLIIIFLFKDPITEAINSIEGLQYKGLKIAFRRGLKIAEHKARELNLPPGQRIPTPTEVPVTSDMHLFNLATTYPRASVSEAWRSVETSLKKLASTHGIPTRGAQAERDVLQKLVLSGDLPSGIADLYDRLRKLRNQAIHAGELDISSEEAASYVDMALSLARSFDTLSNIP